MCYLVLCDQSFSKRLAFSFLEDLQTEFGSTYGSRVETVSRPYSFIEFGKHLSDGYIWTSGLQGFTLTEDSDQTGHSPSLIKVLAVHLMSCLGHKLSCG